MTRTITNLGVITKVNCTIKNEKTNVKQGDYYYKLDVHFLNKNAFDLEVELIEFEIFDSLDIKITNKKTHVTGFSQTLKSGETLADTLELKINSAIGKIEGKYTFKNIKSKQTLVINTPSIQLEHASKLN